MTHVVIKLSLIVYLCFCGLAKAQIPVTNASFESSPGPNVPVNWLQCPTNIGTATMPFGSWSGVALEAYDGQTYLGMGYGPTLPWDAIDSISQQLKCPLVANKQHRLNLHIYTLTENGSLTQYGNGILKIYGGNQVCQTAELLWESPATTNQWKEYTAEFTPSAAWHYITIMPWSLAGLMENIGVDAMSDIYVYDYVFLELSNTASVSDSNCYTLTAQTDMGNVSYQWQSEPPLSFTNTNTQEVCITTDTRVTVTMQSPCGEYRDTVLLKYKAPSSELVFPNAFTPNNDGLNDAFRAINSEASVNNYQLHIYNRWGQLVFTASEPTVGWDGAYQNTQQPAGTYFYTCIYETEKSESKSKKGSVLLIK